MFNHKPTSQMFSVLFVIMFLLTGVLPVQAESLASPLYASGDFVWARSMGGTSVDRGNSLAVDSSGNIYTTGYFAGTADFDPGAGAFNLTSPGGNWDIFISKLDSGGNFVWARNLGGTSADQGYGLALDSSGNVYTTGYFAGTADFDPGAGASNLTSVGYADIFVSKLDSDGNFIWARSLGGMTSNEQGYGIAVDSSGNVYTTGYFAGTVDFDPGAGAFNLTSAGDDDVFVSKLDSSGNFVWAKSMGGTSVDRGNSLALDAGGNVYTTGSFQVTADFDPGAGTSNLTSASRDTFVSKLDSDGNFVWAKKLGGIGSGIALDADSNVYTTGYFAGTADFDPGAGTFNLISTGAGDIFVSKLDSDGNFIWARSLGGTDSDYALDIAVDLSGNVYTTGYFQNAGDFDPGTGTFNLTTTGYYDIFISKLDSGGNFAWAKNLGGAGNEIGYGIAVDSSSNVYTTGTFQVTADFDPGAGTFNLTSAGNHDVFVSKLGMGTAAPSVISGNAGIGEAIITYTGGSATADGSGNYSFTVSSGWTGTITPSKAGYYFAPAYIDVSTSVTADLPDQNFTATSRAFVKYIPVNGAAGVSTSPLLNWQTSAGAASYEYCLDTSNDTVCDTGWVSRGANKSVPLSGLNENTTYYWQVHAISADGTVEANGSAWWNFTTTGCYTLTTSGSPSGSVTASPAPNCTGGKYLSGTVVQLTPIPVYGYTFVNWSGNLSGSSNPASVTMDADKSVTANFNTPPGSFIKYAPGNGATGVTINPLLNWGTSINAASYEYCIDTSNDTLCDTGWVSRGSLRSVGLSGLFGGTTYYWQARAINGDGTIEANGGTWWSFTTLACYTLTTNGSPSGNVFASPATNCPGGKYTAGTVVQLSPRPAYGYTFSTWSGDLSGSANPGSVTMNADMSVTANYIAPPTPFSKYNQANGATSVSINPLLNWGTSINATSYEYCIDTIDNGSCDTGWVSRGAFKSVGLSGLTANTTYYWQARAVNGIATVNANGGTWWSFTTAP